MDDGLHWEFNEKFSETVQGDTMVVNGTNATASPNLITPELRFVLQTWLPAVAGFPLQNEHLLPNAAALASAFNSSRVAPLVQFDPAIALYHVSVVDFVFPGAPEGEGGFSGSSLLSGVWISVLLPQVFKSQAIRINSVLYTDDAQVSAPAGPMRGMLPCAITPIVPPCA
jgi:hypothetical protein